MNALLAGLGLIDIVGGPPAVELQLSIDALTGTGCLHLRTERAAQGNHQQQLDDDQRLAHSMPANYGMVGRSAGPTTNG